MEKLTCGHCGNVDEPILAPAGKQIGAYCSKCNDWIKWIPQGKPKIYFGKYKGIFVHEITDAPYLKWYLESVKKIPATLKKAIKDRISEIENTCK